MLNDKLENLHGYVILKRIQELYRTVLEFFTSNVFTLSNAKLPLLLKR